MATFLVILAACFAVVAFGFAVGLFSSRIDVRLWGAMAATGAAVVVLAVLETAAPHIAGQGDAPRFAAQWRDRWKPGAELECQPRDTDNNGYLTCTVGTPGTDDLTAIECGVNRWYHGLNVTDCRLMRGFSGRQ